MTRQSVYEFRFLYGCAHFFNCVVNNDGVRFLPLLKTNGDVFVSVLLHICLSCFTALTGQHFKPSTLKISIKSPPFLDTLGNFMCKRQLSSLNSMSLHVNVSTFISVVLFYSNSPILSEPQNANVRADQNTCLSSFVMSSLEI